MQVRSVSVIAKKQTNFIDVSNDNMFKKLKCSGNCFMHMVEKWPTLSGKNNILSVRY